VDKVRAQIEPFLSFEGHNAATMVNNYDWTASLSTIDFLRDIGKHFPVNRMLARDVVRTRLEAGISYTEFSYVLLQSMDYLNLFRDHGVRLQTGGSDQWGNITAGVELVRRVEGEKVHALATPLVTKADGTKFGKTESGSIWLDAQMTSPYAFYQFWFNTDDRDVIQYLKYYSFRSRDEIEELAKAVEEEPFRRAAQRALADDLTTLTHGEAETERVKAAAAALFGGGGELTTLDASTLTAALSEAPHVEIPNTSELPLLADRFAETGLVGSKSEARRTVGEGGAYVNNERITDPDARADAQTLLPGGWLLLREGKRNLAGVRVGSA
jgi:tyrosyl-tRNA synthetase